MQATGKRPRRRRRRRVDRHGDAHAGVVRRRLIATDRRSGVIAAAAHAVPAKTSPQGLRPGAMVEMLVLLRVLAGDGLGERATLRRDQGVAALTGSTLPAAAPAPARHWVDPCYDPTRLADRPLPASVGAVPVPLPFP